MPHPEISRSPAHYSDLADAGMGVGIGEYEDGAGTPGEIQSDAKAGAFRPPATQQQQQQLVEQLRQLHVLVDQLIVHEVSFPSSAFLHHPPPTLLQYPTFHGAVLPDVFFILTHSPKTGLGPRL